MRSKTCILAIIQEFKLNTANISKEKMCLSIYVPKKFDEQKLMI